MLIAGRLLAPEKRNYFESGDGDAALVFLDIRDLLLPNVGTFWGRYLSTTWLRVLPFSSSVSYSANLVVH